MNTAHSFIEDLYLTVRKAAQYNINRINAQYLKKRFKFYSYKVRLVQELNEDDFNRRLEFWEVIMTRIDANPNFLYMIFLDKAAFELNGNVNRL